MVAADHYQLCGPMPMIAVSACSHLSPIPDGGCGGAWRWWWQRVVAGIESGLGRKGEGKMANYGVTIDPQTLVDEADLPLALQQPSSASSGHGGEAHKSEPLIPPPIPATSEEVEHWMSSCFKPLTNISTKNPPEVGESILWRGVKTGRSGQPSTKCEYFNGKVRHIAVEPDDHELYVYID